MYLWALLVLATQWLIPVKSENSPTSCSDNTVLRDCNHTDLSNSKLGGQLEAFCELCDEQLAHCTCPNFLVEVTAKAIGITINGDLCHHRQRLWKTWMLCQQGRKMTTMWDMNHVTLLLCTGNNLTKVNLTLLFLMGAMSRLGDPSDQGV